MTERIIKFILPIVIIAIGAIQNSFSFSPNVVRSEDNYIPMVKEGRSWWYTTSWYGRIQFGVSIGSAVEIDGKEWHKIYVNLHYKDITGSKPYDTTYEWIKYDEADGLIGYIREEDKKVYVMAAENSFSADRIPHGALGFNQLFDDANSEILMYDFTDSVEEFSVGNTKTNAFMNFEIQAVDVEENCGVSYPRMICTPKSDSFGLFNDINNNPFYQKTYFVQGIGNTKTFFNNSDAPAYFSLFYSIFMPLTTGAQGIVSLDYVTEGPDREVVYQCEGGPKLWEEYEKAYVDAILEDISLNKNIEYFNLQGMRVEKPHAGQIVIRRQGTKTEKTRL